MTFYSFLNVTKLQGSSAANPNTLKEVSERLHSLGESVGLLVCALLFDLLRNVKKHIPLSVLSFKKTLLLTCRL